MLVCYLSLAVCTFAISLYALAFATSLVFRSLHHLAPPFHDRLDRKPSIVTWLRNVSLNSSFASNPNVASNLDTSFKLNCDLDWINTSPWCDLPLRFYHPSQHGFRLKTTLLKQNVRTAGSCALLERYGQPNNNSKSENRCAMPRPCDATCTMLSIFVLSPITVLRQLPRSMQLFAPMTTLCPTSTCRKANQSIIPRPIVTCNSWGFAITWPSSPKLNPNPSCNGSYFIWWGRRLSGSRPGLCKLLDELCSAGQLCNAEEPHHDCIEC